MTSTRTTRPPQSDGTSWAEDLDLARRAASGDRASRRVVATRLMDRARSTVFYLASDDPDAEDYAQLAILEVLRSAGNFRGECSLERWADRIVVRTAMRHIKRRRWRGNVVALDPDVERQPQRTGRDEPERRQVSRRLAEVLGGLSPERRAVVMLQLVYGHSIAEIAEITASKPNTVRDRLRLGRKQLRKVLARDPLFKEWMNEGGS